MTETHRQSDVDPPTKKSGPFEPHVYELGSISAMKTPSNHIPRIDRFSIAMAVVQCITCVRNASTICISWKTVQYCTIAAHPQRQEHGAAKLELPAAVPGGVDVGPDERDGCNVQ